MTSRSESMTAPLPTPKTDAAALQLANDLRSPFHAQQMVVPADFARAQERRIEELCRAIQSIGAHASESVHSANHVLVPREIIGAAIQIARQP